jgi:hypothetical protein
MTLKALFSRVILLRGLTVVAFVIGLTTFLARPEWTRTTLIDEITDHGGNVTYDNSLSTLFRSQQVVHVNLPERSEITVDDLRVFPHLVTVGLPGVIYSDLGVPGKLVLRLEDIEHLYEMMPKNI